MLQDDVLALLRSCEQDYRSGEAMSRALGVSRAAVWKAVEALRRAGYEITSAPNRGYRLSSAPDNLRAGEIASALSVRVVGREVICLDTVDSTNSEVKRRAAGGAPEGLAVLSDEQTGGRGRRGNSFQSLRGKGLYCSVLLRPACPPEELGQLTAWTAVAVCRAIQSFCGAVCGIKWTNDLILGGRKSVRDPHRAGAGGRECRRPVRGIGYWHQCGADFRRALARNSPLWPPPAQELHRPSRRAELAVRLLHALDELYAVFPAGKADYLAEYRRRCVTTGHQVALLQGGNRHPAFAEAVDDAFALVCRLPDGGGRLLQPGKYLYGACWGMCEPLFDRLAPCFWTERHHP